MAMVHPDDRNRLAEAVKTAWLTTGRLDVEYRFYRPDGELRYLHGRGEVHRSLFESMLNGVAYCRLEFDGDRPVDFVYLAVNPAFETLTGLRNVTGRRVTDVIPGIERLDPELFDASARVSRGGVPVVLDRGLQSLPRSLRRGLRRHHRAETHRGGTAEFAP